MNRPILVTGANGQLGIELQRASWPAGFEPIAVGRSALDLEDPAAIAAKVTAGHRGRRFAAVVNAAAYTAVDKAESDIVTAWKVNALAPAALGGACARAGIPLVQLSTDYVFPGDREGAWRPDDRPAPLGVYGASKLSGELAVRTSGARYAVIRTAWVVSAHGHNFVKTMLQLAETRDTVRVVEDQRGSPTAAADLANVVITIATLMADDPAAAVGIFHFSNAGATTWADLAREVLRQSADRGGPSASVEGIATADYPTPAKRPANSLLDTTAAEVTWGISPRPWQEALGDILDELLGERA